MMWKSVALTVACIACVGCSQAVIDRAAPLKAEANDAQVTTWVLMACDLSLGGVGRSDMPDDLRTALLSYCLGEAP